MAKVLGIDLSSKNWASNGSALLGFDIGASRFAELHVPALTWPHEGITAEALANAVHKFAVDNGVAAVALDGPQGWRDPDTPLGSPGVGRRCEFECRAQAKTGVYMQTFPANQRRWVTFSIAVFDHLLAKPDVRLADADGVGLAPSAGYVVLECYPTSTWNSARLSPLPSKSASPDFRSFAQALMSTFGIPLKTVAGHDDLQAIAAALAAAGYVGGPVEPRRYGAAPRLLDDPASGSRRVEGYIWDALPLLEVDDQRSVPPRRVPPPAQTIGDAEARVRVTQAVIDHVGRAGRAHAQIALSGFPAGRRRELVRLVVELDGESYPLAVGDTHAAWPAHQTDDASSGFDRLFAALADSPGQWRRVTWTQSPALPHAGPDTPLAAQGPPPPDAMARTVAIPVDIKAGQLREVGDKALPMLADCHGTLTVPAFALNAADVERFTVGGSRQLFEPGTRLMCRVSGLQVPSDLRHWCRAVPVPDSAVHGAFVEVVLLEALTLESRGTKKPQLSRCACEIPALDDLEAESLNEAYRHISQRFEPRRRSVGGNVFRSVYYFESALDQWRPIGELRGDVVFPARA